MPICHLCLSRDNQNPDEGCEVQIHSLDYWRFLTFKGPDCFQQIVFTDAEFARVAAAMNEYLADKESDES